MSEVVSVDAALDVIRSVIDAPTPDIPMEYEHFLRRLSVPLRLSEAITDRARQSLGKWLVWGYQQYARKISVSAFCREVCTGLRDMGLDSVPSTETLRGWYYAASHETIESIREADGFGMASACYLADDEDGSRATALCAAAKEVAVETGMGQVTAARLLRVAYSGHDEQEWADGLPAIVGKADESNFVSIYAEWRDGEKTFIGHILNPDKTTGHDTIAAKHIVHLLRVRMR